MRHLVDSRCNSKFAPVCFVADQHCGSGKGPIYKREGSQGIHIKSRRGPETQYVSQPPTLFLVLHETNAAITLHAHIRIVLPDS